MYIYTYIRVHTAWLKTQTSKVEEYQQPWESGKFAVRTCWECPLAFKMVDGWPTYFIFAEPNFTITGTIPCKPTSSWAVIAWIPGHMRSMPTGWSRRRAKLSWQSSRSSPSDLLCDVWLRDFEIRVRCGACQGWTKLTNSVWSPVACSWMKPELNGLQPSCLLWSCWVC